MWPFTRSPASKPKPPLPVTEADLDAKNAELSRRFDLIVEKYGRWLHEETIATLQYEAEEVFTEYLKRFIRDA